MRRKKISKRFKKKDDSETKQGVRLNKYIANTGISSRRDADQLIQKGKIKINGKVITLLGTRVHVGDSVEYKGKILKSEKLQYVLFNKPKDLITTMEDPQNRRTVMDMVDKACKERIYPVGRLDRHTTGLLLFTNDGQLAKKLTHPSHRIKKIYAATLDKPLTKIDFDHILKGVELEDGVAMVDELAIISDDSKNIGVRIHIGRNRIIRLMFEHLGYKVIKLDRTMFGSLTKKDLPRGKWRHLNIREVQNLKKQHTGYFENK